MSDKGPHKFLTKRYNKLNVIGNSISSLRYCIF